MKKFGSIFVIIQTMGQKIKLNFPDVYFRLREQGGRDEIWDSIRCRWLVLTPEEWVRQHVIHYLSAYKQADPMLIQQEQGLKLHGMSRRADIVVYDRSASPRMIVECKAPHVKLTQEVLEQVVRYNLVLEVPYVLITNGMTHYCFAFDFDTKRYNALSVIPDLG